MLAALKSLYRQMAEADAIDLALRSTLIILLFSSWFSGGDWRFFTPLLVLAFTGLMLPKLLRNRWLWTLIALCLVLKSTVYWWSQDNHIFVMTYWSLAVALGLWRKDGEAIIATNGRYLVGLAFAFAVLWKGFLSPEFMNGHYFHYAFLTDNRFSEEARMLSGITYEELAENRQLQSKVAGEVLPEATLKTNENLRLATIGITWHTIIIEALLVLSFFWPLGRGPSRWRNYLLILFSWTTYLAAPVYTFGWTLNTLAIAATRKEEGLERCLLVLTLPVLFIYYYTPLMRGIESFISPLLWE